MPRGAAPAPQHASAPSVATAQLYAQAASTDWNDPAGTCVWPRPQHSRSPSARTAHVWRPPDATAMKGPAGGLAWKLESSPRHTTSPPDVRPQKWRFPALTDTNGSPHGSTPGWDSTRLASRGEVTSHRPAVGSAGKNRRWGSTRSPHAPPAPRSCRASSIRPSSRSCAEMRRSAAPPASTLARTVTTELGSHRPTRADAGTNLLCGNNRAPHVPSGPRSWRANSVRPSSRRWAASRTSVEPTATSAASASLRGSKARASAAATANTPRQVRLDRLIVRHTITLRGIQVLVAHAAILDLGPTPTRPHTTRDARRRARWALRGVLNG